MEIYPLPTKPTITNNDIIAGYVNRYFLKNTANGKITEVTKYQYNRLKINALYQGIVLKWIITGNLEDTTSRNGYVIRGTRYQNEQIVEFYNEKMPGLKRVLNDPIEFFYGTINNLG